MSSTGAETDRPARRKPQLAWVAPIAAAALAVGGGVLAHNTASAEPPLPRKTTHQLLTAVAGAHVDGLSGTVTETANLGLPSLPTGDQGGPTSSSNFSDLLSGSHTLNVWTSGSNKSRVALMGTYGESDLIRNGNQTWLWSSKDKTAEHTRFSGTSPDAQRQSVPGTPGTPQQMADQALKAIGPTTATRVDRNVRVAHRTAYELVLTPKDSRSLVNNVTIAVDSKTSVPLGVWMTADGQSKPAISVAFSKVDFSVPNASTFDFTPPKGSKITEHTVTAPSKSDRAGARKQADKAAAGTKTVGTGWTTVVISKQGAGSSGLPGLPGGRPGDQSRNQSGKQSGKQSGGTDQMLQALPRVSGSWGSGRLLSSALFTAVITDDGRIAVGAVRPQLVYDALQK